MERYPLSLLPVPKQILWGGTKLKEKYGKTAPFENIAESWELTVRSDGMNNIGNGIYAGMSLADYLAQEEQTAERFPLLIKFIDARDDLSVQVHPDNAYSLANEGELGKTEFWYILEADENAQLVYGLKEGLTVADFSTLVQSGKTMDGLHFVPVHKGDCFFIPSGQLHAIGKGILLAEIQQSSNVTYRVYDYDRRQKDGSLRQLHVAKALDVICPRTEAEIDSLRFSDGKDSENTLVNCEYFTVTRLTLSADTDKTLESAEMFRHLLVTDGEGVLTCDGTAYPLCKGNSYFLPANCPACTLCGTAEILISSAK